jgi:hypothetical protein
VKLQQFRRALFIQTRDGLGVITSRMGTTMKKVLLVTASLIAISATAPALAADLAARPYTKAPPMVAAIYDWSGFYVGANGGWGSSRNRWDSVSPFLVGATNAKVTAQGFAQEDKVLLVQRPIQAPVFRHALALPFPRLHGQQHIQRVARHTGQAKDNHAHDKESQQTL